MVKKLKQFQISNNFTGQQWNNKIFFDKRKKKSTIVHATNISTNKSQKDGSESSDNIKTYSSKFLGQLMFWYWVVKYLACSHQQNIISSRKQNKTELKKLKKKNREKGSQTLNFDWVMQQNQVLTPKLRQINSFWFGFSFVLLLNFYCQQWLASFKVTHDQVYMLKSIPKQKQNKNYNQSIVKAC